VSTLSTLAGLEKRVLALERQTAPTASPLLDQIRRDPCRVMAAAGMAPDPWQRDLLVCGHRRILLLAARQSGKSQVTAALALRVALCRPGALVLLLSPSLRQSSELFRDKLLRLFNALDRPVPALQLTALQLTLANGSRIVSLPGDESTIRGFSGVTTLIVDEASRISDALYFSVRPMLAVSQGRLILLSTPFGRRGIFYESWVSHDDWLRVRVPAAQCPRISKQFLDEERQALGEHWYQQEYECEFRDVIDQFFRTEDIEAACANDIEPLFAR
jgi:hypothetical protein